MTELFLDINSRPISMSSFSRCFVLLRRQGSRSVGKQIRPDIVLWVRVLKAVAAAGRVVKRASSNFWMLTDGIQQNFCTS